MWSYVSRAVEVDRLVSLLYGIRWLSKRSCNIDILCIVRVDDVRLLKKNDKVLRGQTESIFGNSRAEFALALLSRSLLVSLMRFQRGLGMSGIDSELRTSLLVDSDIISCLHFVCII